MAAMVGRLLDALFRWLRALLGSPPIRPRPLYPPPGPARPLHANSVEHGDQHRQIVTRPPGPPGPPPRSKP